MPSLLQYEGPAVLFEHVEDKQGALIDVSFAGIMPNATIELSVLELGDKERKIGTVKGKLLGKLTERLGLLPAAPQAEKAPEPSVRLRFKSQSATHEFTFPLSADKFDKDEGCAWQVKARIEGLGAESPTIALARSRRQPELLVERESNEQHEGYSAYQAKAHDNYVPTLVETDATAGGETYDWHAGHSVQFYADGSVDATGTAGALHDICQAIREAQHFVFIVDWSFQPLFCPSRKAPLSRAGSIGALLVERAVANPQLVIAIHTWNHTAGLPAAGAGAAPDPGNDDAEQTFNDLAVARPANLLWRASCRTGSGWSHHQKFVVLDTAGDGGRRELKVFWGGLDLTKGRFDWHEHVVDATSRLARTFLANDAATGDDWYNAEFETLEANMLAALGRTQLPRKAWGELLEKKQLSSIGDMVREAGGPPFDRFALPRQPWHDIHGRLTGPAAWDFVREFVGRWNVVEGGFPLGDYKSDPIEKVWKLFRKLYEDRATFVQQYEGLRKGTWSAQVYRSLSLVHWAPPKRAAKDDLDKRLYSLLHTSKASVSEQSIRNGYHQNIDRAERFIYIENQYFLGSGRHWDNPSLDNDIPERIVNRILKRVKTDGVDFHVYIVMPMFPEGDPVSGGSLEVRFSEWSSIQYMVNRLHEAFDKKWINHLSFYFPANWSVKPHSTGTTRIERVRDHQRYMIYVHSKLMIVDDRYALFGSCNLNDRGLSGSGDSEIACGVWPSFGHADAAVSLKQFRLQLWQEHFGKRLAGADEPESLACVQAARTHADENYANFRTMRAPPQGHMCRLPLVLNAKKRLAFPKLGGLPDDYRALPDAPMFSGPWSWGSETASMIRILGVAE